MRGASSADKLMVSHKAGHELLLLLLPLTDKQTGRTPSPLSLQPYIHYAAIAVVARRGPATLCGSFFGRLQQLPASKLSGKVCWLANNNGDMRLQCATNEGKQARAEQGQSSTSAASRYPALPALLHKYRHTATLCHSTAGYTGAAACCRRWHKLAVLFAAVGNNSAANEINCAHTDNCMGGKQERRGRGCTLVGVTHSDCSQTYAMIFIKKTFMLPRQMHFGFMIENITHTQCVRVREGRRAMNVRLMSVSRLSSEFVCYN